MIWKLTRFERLFLLALAITALLAGLAEYLAPALLIPLGGMLALVFVPFPTLFLYEIALAPIYFLLRYGLTPTGLAQRSRTLIAAALALIAVVTLVVDSRRGSGPIRADFARTPIAVIAFVRLVAGR